MFDLFFQWVGVLVISHQAGRFVGQYVSHYVHVIRKRKGTCICDKCIEWVDHGD